ncbi:torsin-1A-interacting protein 1-like [Homarus americanus]|uniref:Torsin-1A-interacting protein 1-like n=1 Tax=Homarus americanus TaxID=6706 RepID=A0A8J5JJH2_HOMAM|nr:torsin-1A-interacting protein 1-like [Homarus americanus]XP_042239513.1 torsin-1A-interacting protein 1-like [Homarus americanus]KAG7159252.1 Torsin-1A-interacting protein 1-like [Homarus americanus]
MPNPKVETRATARPGLRDSSTSPPSLGEKSPRTRSRGNAGRSPARYKTKDDMSSDEDTQGTDYGDEVDRITSDRSPRLYPELPLPLPDDFDLSPKRVPFSKSDTGSLNDSYGSTHSRCSSRSGPSSPRKDNPLTPMKGSPGKKIYPDLIHKDTKQSRRGASPVTLIFFFTLVLVSILVLYYHVEETDKLQKSKVHKKSVEEVYKDLKNELQTINAQITQPRHFWVQLIGQIDSIMVQNPRQPAIILVVAPKDARGTATCLIHKIAEAVNYAFGDSRFVMYDVKSDMHVHPRTLKQELDNVLQGLSETHAAVIHSIEAIPGEAAMIFHAYCDNENAPFKQAIIFPIIEVDYYYENLAHKRLDNTVDDLLAEIWGVSLLPKDVSAIVSRIANAPVLIKPETPGRVKELCPI